MLLTSKMTSARVRYVNFSPIEDLRTHLGDYNSTFLQTQQKKT